MTQLHLRETAPALTLGHMISDVTQEPVSQSADQLRP